MWIENSPRWQINDIRATILAMPIVHWDIDPLYYLGRSTFMGMTGGRQGTGDGARTIQLSVNGGPLKAYYAGAVNYILWGHVFRFYHKFEPKGTDFSLSTAIRIAKEYKFVAGFRMGRSPAEEQSAYAFIKFGYDGTAPSSIALPLPSNPGNVVTARC